MSAAARARLLPAVIVALAVAAALKVGDLWLGFDGASAQTQPLTAMIEAQQQAETAKTEPQDAPPPELQSSEVERRILEQLADRRTALEMREQALDTREAVIAAAEIRLEESIAEFRQERERLLALRSDQEAQDAAQIEALISAYERMRSKDAAAIFNALDEDILVAVASGMRTQALAGALAEMQPEKARQLTILLAERERIGAATAPAEQSIDGAGNAPTAPQEGDGPALLP